MCYDVISPVDEKPLSLGEIGGGIDGMWVFKAQLKHIHIIWKTRVFSSTIREGN